MLPASTSFAGVAIANGSIPPAVVRAITAVLAVVAVIAFVVLSVYSIVQTLQADTAPPDLSSGILYVTAALTALVGGIVAVAFGVILPDPDPPAPPGPTPALLTRNLRALTAVTTAQHRFDVGAVIGSLYAILYFLIGLIACFVWLFSQDTAADPVKALSSTFIGLLLPIVRGYFTPK